MTDDSKPAPPAPVAQEPQPEPDALVERLRRLGKKDAATEVQKMVDSGALDRALAKHPAFASLPGYEGWGTLVKPPIEHTRSCAFVTTPDGEECTCGYEWRIRLGTYMTMYNAWRKLAEEAEAELAQARRVIAAADRLRAKCVVPNLSVNEALAMLNDYDAARAQAGQGGGEG